jgi:hypothetical protein
VYTTIEQFKQIIRAEKVKTVDKKIGRLKIITLKLKSSKKLNTSYPLKLTRIPRKNRLIEKGNEQSKIIIQNYKLKSSLIGKNFKKKS